MTDTTCSHDAAELEHSGQHGTEVEFWLACPDCDGYWEVSADLADETAHITRER